MGLMSTSGAYSIAISTSTSTTGSDLLENLLIKENFILHIATGPNNLGAQHKLTDQANSQCQKSKNK
jgi:hypothetical protein